ncbi:MAG TPA: hypothetical protein VHN37_08305 [Actinomycetota bacterium]|nr:hypothetical protein [Actinomycetota bacterium]
MGETIAAVAGTLLLSAAGLAFLIYAWARSGDRSRRDWIVLIGVLVAIQAVFLFLRFRD